MSIRHSDTVFHRNIFVEDGLVALVTSYHKGYTCTGTTKIIHRYLPREVSELLIYYLSLILPFKKQLETLALLQNQEKSSFPVVTWRRHMDKSKALRRLEERNSSYV
jgi:hypothetical protein